MGRSPDQLRAGSVESQEDAGQCESSRFNPEQPSGSGQPLASLYENYFTSYGTSVSNWKFAPGLGERVGDWYRVGYTKENTVAKAEQSPYINTGVVFKASYGPKKCIVYDPVSGKAIERTGLDGTPFTFFAYKGVIYNSAEAVMAAFTGNGTNVVGYDLPVRLGAMSRS